MPRGRGALSPWSREEGPGDSRRSGLRPGSPATPARLDSPPAGRGEVLLPRLKPKGRAPGGRANRPPRRRGERRKRGTLTGPWNPRRAGWSPSRGSPTGSPTSRASSRATIIRTTRRTSRGACRLATLGRRQRGGIGWHGSRRRGTGPTSRGRQKLSERRRKLSDRRPPPRPPLLPGPDTSATSIPTPPFERRRAQGRQARAYPRPAACPRRVSGRASRDPRSPPSLLELRQRPPPPHRGLGPAPSPRKHQPTELGWRLRGRDPPTRWPRRRAPAA